MPDSPISATPYEVLGVSPEAGQEELRRAYRQLLRQTHPDTGGDAARFVAVQRAWERVGTPARRAAYDSGRTRRSEQPRSWAAPSARPARRDTRPHARSYGHPGGWRRERYLTLMREWVGRGASLDDPYNPALVRSAPREIRHILADALAEEATAATVATLGIGYTIWHDVATGDPEQKLDHVVLGPSGLFAILSEDYGNAVRVRRGELVGDPLGDERPIHELGTRVKRLRRQIKVRFTGLVIVLPDDALGEPMTVLGQVRGATTVAVRRSNLAALLRGGIPGTAPIGGNELFDLRTKLQSGIRFV